MASVSHAFVGFSLANPRTVGPAALPAGLSKFSVSFDASGFTAGQLVWLSVDLSADNGATWQSVALADFDGPWKDKSGVTQTVVGLTFTLGLAADGVTQVVSGAGWQMRGSLSPVNGPVAIGAGNVSAA